MSPIGFRSPSLLAHSDGVIELVAMHESGIGPSVWTGRALQAESSERQWLVLRFCIRPLGGADRSWPSWISARVRSQFSDRPSKARWATRSRTRRRDHSPFLKFNSQTSAGISHFKCALARID